MRRVARRAVARFEESCKHPEEVQRRRLEGVLRGARATGFAKEHGLRGNEGFSAYRAAVPIRTDSEYGPWLRRASERELGVLTRASVTSLLKTSGTTGPSKLLPVTAAYEEAVAAGQALWRLALVRDHEAVARGKVLTVVSPAHEGRSEGGVRFGSNTGRMHARQPWLVRSRYAVPAAVHALEDPEARLYATLRYALQEDVRLLVTANPSTVLRLARGLRRHLADLMADLAEGGMRRGPGGEAAAKLPSPVRKRLRRGRARGAESLARAWDLAAVACWTGGPAPWFLDRFPEALGARIPVRDVGVTASEGYFAIPVADGDAGGVAWLGGHVLEFVDEGGDPRWAWEVEVGQTYRLVITTSAGLYRYDLDDLVEVTGHVGRAPVIRFVRKAAAVLSVTGEKVTEAHVLGALAEAVQGPALGGVSVGHRMDDVPALRMAVEGGEGEDLEALAARFDDALRAGNVEYASKRATGRLGPVEATRLPAGTYARWRADRQREGAPATQLKEPVLLRDDRAWAQLERAARSPVRGVAVAPGGASLSGARPRGPLEGVQVVSWDVDGTLYPMPHVVRGATWLAVRRLLSRRAPQEAAELLVLSRFRRAMEAARRAGGRLPPGSLEGFSVPRSRIIDMERRWYGPPIAAVGLWPGVSELLDLFDQLGMRQVVVSDYQAAWKLDALGIAHRFERVYAGETVGALKPSPEVFEHVVRDLAVPPGCILHLGDRPETDGVAASAAGLRVRIFDQGFLTPQALYEDLRRSVSAG